MDAGGQVVAATDAEPVSGAYPTTAWRPGEVVADAYEIPLPAGLPPGDYRPLVIVYDPATGAELGRAELEPVYLAGQPGPPAATGAGGQRRPDRLCPLWRRGAAGLHPARPRGSLSPRRGAAADPAVAGTGASLPATCR